ncbi:MAG: hypothetical protein KJO05_10565 [Bacteroidia bacterium]|nr:hypothetical protein [Bacteroidia bacterium]NNF30492.1 hypothetical protein [Flavobacteriaceae bacterium]MBT8276530.1 hypothetical protein [Bacteroidia bacterium]NNJ82496.1 hypothetical protein [Flavobacteriaceae bacterium]NNK53860.1 hypothetical protein [Flavobacteriaceae bacterium]
MYTNNIMLTGYWEPTNEMLRPFSKNRALNPTGWIGRNWDNSGFNVYAFFPEFDDDSDGKGVGIGDLTVDYQDTLNDFYRLVKQLNPCAIISFSRDREHHGWTVETAAKVYPYIQWAAENAIMPDDERLEPPYRPRHLRWDPIYPPDDSGPSGWRGAPIENILGLGTPNTIFNSTLPIDNINRMIDASRLYPARLFSNPQEFDRIGNQFLSNFIACLVMKYQEDHLIGSEGFECGAAGHVHVGGMVTPEDGTIGTNITLKETIKVLRERLPFTFVTRFRITFHTAEILANSDSAASVRVCIKRDGAPLAAKRINTSGGDLTQGASTNVEFSFRSFRMDPENPDGLDLAGSGVGGGVEFFNGIFGKFSIELQIEGQDDWIVDEVILEIKELFHTSSAGRLEPLYRVSDWKTAGKWRQLKRLSTNTRMRGLPARSRVEFKL